MKREEQLLQLYRNQLDFIEELFEPALKLNLEITQELLPPNRLQVRSQ